MRQLCVSSLIAALAIGATATSVEAGPQRRVGVVVTLAVGVEADIATAVADALAAALRAELPVDVISGAEVVRRLPPGGLPEDCVGQPACRNDLGRRLDADELLLLAVVAVGDSINADATWADVASGRTASRPRVSLAPGADRQVAFAAVARQYLPHIREEPKPPGPQVVVVRTPDSRRDDRSRRINTPVLIAGGATVAAAITGGVLALAARSRHRDLEDRNCRVEQCPQAEIDGGRHLALGADIAFATALAAGVAAGVLYYLSAPAGDSKTVAPSIGPGQVGVSLGGRF